MSQDNQGVAAQVPPLCGPTGGAAEASPAKPAAANADPQLIYEALRFFLWAAGQGISPVEGEPADDPEECWWQYGLRTGDEHWETVAERYRALAQARGGQ